MRKKKTSQGKRVKFKKKVPSKFLKNTFPEGEGINSIYYLGGRRAKEIPPRKIKSFIWPTIGLHLYLGECLEKMLEMGPCFYINNNNFQILGDFLTKGIQKYKNVWTAQMREYSHEQKKITETAAHDQAQTPPANPNSTVVPQKVLGRGHW